MISGSSANRLEGGLHTILLLQLLQIKESQRMSVSVEQLTADVNALKAAGEKYHADVVAAIQNLKDQIAAGQGSNPDLSALDALVQSMTADAGSADAEVAASVAAAAVASVSA